MRQGKIFQKSTLTITRRFNGAIEKGKVSLWGTWPHKHEAPQKISSVLSKRVEQGKVVKKLNKPLILHIILGSK